MASIEIRIPITEGPKFLDEVFLEENNGEISIGVTKDNGAIYAETKMSKEDFTRYAEILLGKRLD